MAHRLTIHFPTSSITFETDNPDKLIKLSDFCKEELGAYHSTEIIEELTVDEIDQNMSNKIHSLLFELGLL